MQRPPLRVSGPVIGSDDPLSLADFYSRLLGWPIVEREFEGVDGAEAGWAKIRSPVGDQKLEFQYEPYFIRPVWPPARGEQQMLMHLDIGTPDLDAGVAWAIEVGAVVAEYQPQSDVRIMLDPAGHPFCLFRDS